MNLPLVPPNGPDDPNPFDDINFVDGLRELVPQPIKMRVVPDDKDIIQIKKNKLSVGIDRSFLDQAAALLIWAAEVKLLPAEAQQAKDLLEIIGKNEQRRM